MLSTGAVNVPAADRTRPGMLGYLTGLYSIPDRRSTVVCSVCPLCVALVRACGPLCVADGLRAVRFPTNRRSDAALGPLPLASTVRNSVRAYASRKRFLSVSLPIRAEPLDVGIQLRVTDLTSLPPLRHYRTAAYQYVLSDRTCGFSRRPIRYLTREIGCGETHAQCPRLVRLAV